MSDIEPKEHQGSCTEMILSNCCELAVNVQARNKIFVITFLFELFAITFKYLILSQDDSTLFIDFLSELAIAEDSNYFIILIKVYKVYKAIFCKHSFKLCFFLPFKEFCEFINHIFVGVIIAYV